MALRRVAGATVSMPFGRGAAGSSGAFALAAGAQPPATGSSLSKPPSQRPAPARSGLASAQLDQEVVWRCSI
jgi:hypothetical protein